MKYNIQKSDAVYGADGVYLGRALRIYRNPDDERINPEQGVYRDYLYVFNIALPMRYYVPLDLIARYDREAGNVHVSRSEEWLREKLMVREPQFVAAGWAEQIPLGPMEDAAETA